jgi:hypothetical protein
MPEQAQFVAIFRPAQGFTAKSSIFHIDMIFSERKLTLPLPDIS